MQCRAILDFGMAAEPAIFATQSMLGLCGLVGAVGDAEGRVFGRFLEFSSPAWSSRAVISQQGQFLIHFIIHSHHLT